MKLYHGTNMDFCQILLDKCKSNKDLIFDYVSEEWARFILQNRKARGKRMHDF